MAGRPLLTLALALFFAALAPLALACEVSAQGHASCMAEDCGRADGLAHCASESALGSAPLFKAGGHDLPSIPLARLATIVAAPLPSPHPSAGEQSAGALMALPRRSSLLAQGVLLRI